MTTPPRFGGNESEQEARRAMRDEEDVWLAKYGDLRGYPYEAPGLSREGQADQAAYVGEYRAWAKWAQRAERGQHRTIWIDTPYGSYPFVEMSGAQRFFSKRGGQIRVGHR